MSTISRHFVLYTVYELDDSRPGNTPKVLGGGSFCRLFEAPPPIGRDFFFYSLLLSSLELSDTNVLEPQTRALLGTAANLYKGIVFQLRTGPTGYRWLTLGCFLY